MQSLLADNTRHARIDALRKVRMQTNVAGCVTAAASCEVRRNADWVASRGLQLLDAEWRGGCKGDAR